MLKEKLKLKKPTTRGTIRLIDKLEDWFVLLLCVLLLLTGCYSFYDTYKVYNDADDDTLLKFKPGSDVSGSDKVISEGMVAWITIDATEEDGLKDGEGLIDYPVMQGDNNTEYLNLNPYGEYSLSGSIFLDSRNAADFSDDYSLIYGHHMEGGTMFGKLDYFTEEEFFNTHRTGTLTLAVYDADTKTYTYTTEYKLTIFAVLETMAENNSTFAPTDVSASTTWNFVKNNAMLLDMDGIDESARLLGISTCKYPDTSDRTMVFATISD